ncbi:MAG: beta-1,6-N-acetylglucosaminyltransferase, partial [Pseudomonadota bacterium]
MAVIGAIILAHERLDRVAMLAHHLTDNGIKVVVHVDIRVSPTELAPLAGLDVIQTQASDWGSFGLVQACLDAAEVLLCEDTISHICLLSGACLPMQPVAALQDYLKDHPGRDFIESVDLAHDQWVQDGLSLERFTLWHPFSHRKTPRLFSTSVEVQRWLRVRRKVPHGLTPHLGAQWWCLSAATLRSILSDPRLPEWKRFFRTAWIPDESFFQTIVPAVAKHPTLPRMTFVRFDPRGKPYVFHDDHFDFLQQQDAYFARKIDPDAAGLYQKLLSHPTERAGDRQAGDPIGQARAQETQEGRGLLGAGRYPGGTTQSSVETVCPYMVLVAEDRTLMNALYERLAGQANCRLHRAPFAPGQVDLIEDAATIPGNLTTNAVIRDYRPAQFLQRLVWVERDQGTAFLYAPQEPAPEAGQMVGDGNARLVFLGEDHRLLNLMRQPLPPKRRFRLRARPPKLRTVWAWTRRIEITA